MKLTLENFEKLLPEDILKKASLDLVRECDELEKGHFVAYIDQGKESFDVFLKLNTKGEIADLGCKCQSGTICRHIAALMLFSAKGQKVKARVKTGRQKVNPQQYDENLTTYLPYFEMLYKELSKHFDTAQIRKLLHEVKTQSRYFTPNVFVRYLNEQVSLA